MTGPHRRAVAMEHRWMAPSSVPSTKTCSCACAEALELERVRIGHIAWLSVNPSSGCLSTQCALSR